MKLVTDMLGLAARTENSSYSGLPMAPGLVGHLSGGWNWPDDAAHGSWDSVFLNLKNRSFLDSRSLVAEDTRRPAVVWTETGLNHSKLQEDLIPNKTKNQPHILCLFSSCTRESFCNIVANLLIYEIIVSEFGLQLLYDVFHRTNTFEKGIKVSKVGDRRRGRPEGSLFNSYYTKV